MGWLFVGIKHIWFFKSFKVLKSHISEYFISLARFGLHKYNTNSVKKWKSIPKVDWLDGRTFLFPFCLSITRGTWKKLHTQPPFWQHQLQRLPRDIIQLKNLKVNRSQEMSPHHSIPFQLPLPSVVFARLFCLSQVTSLPRIIS